MYTSLDDPCSLLSELVAVAHELDGEQPWLEFKQSNSNPQLIGEYLSALSNSAAVSSQPFGYLVYGVADETFDLVGTDFNPYRAKVKGQDLEPWLRRNLEPPIDIQIRRFPCDDASFVIFQVQAAPGMPVAFQRQKFIRLKSQKTLLCNHPEIERRIWTSVQSTIADLYTSDPIPDGRRDAIINQISTSLVERGWRLDSMELGDHAWGCTCPSFNVRLVAQRPAIQLSCLPQRWLAYERGGGENLRAFVLADARRKGGDLYNHKKIRIASDFIDHDVTKVEIQETDYLSSAMTDQLRWVRIRSKKLAPNGLPAEVLWDGVAALIDHTEHGKARLKSLSEVNISNQVGGSTLAFSKDGHLMIVAQNDINRESVNMLAPSGSGSFDWSDFERCRSQDLLSLVRFAADRELREECALEEQGSKYPRLGSKVLVTAFARMLHRGGKPEFFCLGYIDALLSEICDRKPERYVQRVFPADVPRANWAHTRPSREIIRVCSGYLHNSFLDSERKRIPLSYPLEHGLRLLIEISRQESAAIIIDQFIHGDSTFGNSS